MQYFCWKGSAFLLCCSLRTSSFSTGTISQLCALLSIVSIILQRVPLTTFAIDTSASAFGWLLQASWFHKLDLWEGMRLWLHKRKVLLTFTKPYAKTCLYLSPHRCYAKRIAASLTTSKLSGCVSHAKCQESTRHQLCFVVILTKANLSWLLYLK